MVTEPVHEVYYTISMPLKASPFRTIAFYVGAAGDTWQNVEVSATLLLPSDQPGVVILPYTPMDGWSVADYALFFMTLGVSVNLLYGSQAIGVVAGGYEILTYAPQIVCKIGGRTWNLWYDAAYHTSLGFGASRSVALQGTAIAGGSAGNLMAQIGTTFGMERVGLAWTGLLSHGFMSLPAWASVGSLIANYDSWTAGVMFTRNVALPYMGSTGVAVARATPGVTRMVLQAGADFVVESSRTVGRGVGALVYGAEKELPENVKGVLGSIFRGGTATIAIVVGSLLFLSIYRATRMK